MPFMSLRRGEGFQRCGEQLRGLEPGLEFTGVVEEIEVSWRSFRSLKWFSKVLEAFLTRSIKKVVCEEGRRNSLVSYLVKISPQNPSHNSVTSEHRHKTYF